MSACSRRTCGTCFYCDGQATRHEHDHAPVPRRLGGVDTVVACMMCHGLKDRHPIEKWPLHLVVMASVELAGHGLSFDSPPTTWPSCWGDLTGHARTLWAKCAALSQDAEAAGRLPDVPPEPRDTTATNSPPQTLDITLCSTQ